MTDPQHSLLSKERLEWLKKWEEADYSWDGLASKKAPWNSGSDNLQDFWRKANNTAGLRADDDMGQELVDFEGRGVYHVAYVPDYWSDGTPAKVHWDDEQRLLAEHTLLKKIVAANSHSSGAYFHDDKRVEYGGLIFSERHQVKVFEGNVGSLVHCNLPSALSIGVVAKADFTECLFEEFVGQEGIGPSGTVDRLYFHECTFLGEVRFSNTTIQKSTFLGESIFCKKLTFWRCNFEELANLELIDCGSDFCAYKCAFVGGISLNSSRFSDGFSIKNCQISDNADFENLSFENWMSLNSSDISCRCTFASSTWTSAEPESASMEDTTFSDSLNLVCNTPPPIQLFANARFKEAVIMSNHDEKDWDVQFKAELKNADVAYKNKQFVRNPYDSIIGGCQVLQTLARIDGNSNKEFLWHRFELVSRRNSITRFNPEKIFSYIYSVTADYGLSIPRPFAFLVISAVVMGLLFAFIANNGAVSASADWDNIWQGISFSFSRTFPIGVFGPDQEWVERLLGNGSSFSSIVIRSVATLQTFGSVVLIYLGVMSVRRKFKIG